ncbi:MAG: 1-acyl-sn-glycerol-3-phosphate acyltransferase [Chloroflexota bacterium]|nr:1-acyl-sn-glycerol-3-phosphate acyltransferase [Chloroflexota bacterium]
MARHQTGADSLEGTAVLMAGYPFPWDVFFGLVKDLPGGERSFLADCQTVKARISPPPIVEGTEHIARRGPLVVAANHYQRRGLWIGWPGTVITVALAECREADPPIHWLATAGLRLSQHTGRGPEIPCSRLIFQHVARIYGMAALSVSGRRARAQSLRAWLRWLGEGQVVGVFPEGLAGRSDALRPAETGFDGLLTLIYHQGAPILPVGIYECGETLRVRFGEPLVGPPNGDAVMRAIASLIPPRMRGPYGEEGQA